MDETLHFFVRSGSSDETYELRVVRAKGSVAFLCNCAGAQAGTICKHRMNLLVGDLDNLDLARSSNPAGLADLVSGTPLARELARLDALEQEARVLKTRIAQQKKSLAQAMFGRGANVP